MRIGLVLSSPPGYSETFLRSKIKALLEAGHEVVLFTGHRKQAAINQLCDVRFARPVDSRFPILQIFRIGVVLAGLLIRIPLTTQRFWRLERADGATMRKSIERIYINSHILLEELDWLHFGFTTMALGRQNVAKAIGSNMATSFRGYDVSIYPVKNGFDCYEKIWPKLDKIHTISNGLLDVARKQLGLAKHIPVVKISPAISVSGFLGKAERTDSQGLIRLLTVGRLHWVKGLDYAVEACFILKEKGLDFSYTIVGDGESFEHLRFLIHLLDMEDCIFLVGKKEPRDVSGLMRASDIYLQPSVSEGFCNAVLEAQAAGLLCIVSDAGGLPENVVNGETGWVVPKRDSKRLAERIGEIANSGITQQRGVRERAIERVTRDFCIEKHSEKWTQFYS